MAAVWAAYYPGLCSNCLQHFPPRTMVTYDGKRVVHEVCEPADVEQVEAMGPNERKMYREQMCPRCFTVHGPGQEECS